jgi:hypothetical protein
MKYFIVILFILSSCSSNEFSNKIKNVETNKTYTMFEVDKMPMFPGGNDSIIYFINSHNKELNEVYQIDFSGYVYFSFVIDKEGNLKYFELLGTDPMGVFSKNFGIIFNKMPKWKPGEINGVKVNTLICYPYLFVLK